MIRRRKIGARGILGASLVLVAVAPAAYAASLEQISVGVNGAGNGARFAQYRGSSADGTRVIFDTNEALTADDLDGQIDIFERANGVTTRLSLGPNGGNGVTDPVFRAVSDDGERVFFQTGEKLLASDTDGRCHASAEQYSNCSDVYERSGGTTTLVSASPTSTNGDFVARFRGISKDGLHVFFSTAEQLVASDTDAAIDVYERFAGATTLVSTGPADGNADLDAFFKGCSDDGTRVFIATQDQLTSTDHDSEGDIYERSGGTTAQLSIGPLGGNGAFGSSFKGASADGTRVFIETDEPLTAGDTDAHTDVYQRLTGGTSLLSTGPAGGNGAKDAFFGGASHNGTRVWVETDESLVAGDTDGRQDVYERSGITTTLVSTGPSGGSGDFEANFQSSSEDGTRVWIGTLERLAPTDTDSMFDVYERAGGTATQVTLGPAGGNGASDAYLTGAVPDGSRVFFETIERLVAEDTDAYVDAYQRYGGNTTLITTGPNGTQDFYASFLASNDNGSRIFIESGDRLLAPDTDAETDIYMRLDTGVYARPRGATPMIVPLVIAYRDCTSSNRTHGAPLAHPSCTPPVPTSSWLTVGTPDANGQPVGSIGSVFLKTVVGDSSTPADEADLKLMLDVTDVRRKDDLTDYAGQVQVRLAIRITDRLSGASPVDPGTVQDIPFNFTGSCVPTAGATGSSCSVSTTADALAPGTIVEDTRAVWQIGSVELYDGGSDGNVTTSPNTLFERQGVFVP